MIDSISGIATGMSMQRLGTLLRQQFEKRGAELASGLKSDIARAVQGDTGQLFELERRIGRIDAQARNLSLADSRLASLNLVLGSIGETAAGTGLQLLGATGRGDIASARIEAAIALGGFDKSVAALNVRNGGRSLFAGAAVDRPALAGSKQILDELQALTAVATDAASVIDIVEDYFMDPTGGFMSDAYLGSAASAADTELAQGESIENPIRADDPAICAVLRDLALAALVARGAFAGNPDVEMEVLQAAGEGLAGDGQAIQALIAATGMAQERIELARTRQSAERTAFEITRNNIVAADPYQTAAEFQALQNQMESHYLVTARLSQMSLTAFLR